MDFWDNFLLFKLSGILLNHKFNPIRKKKQKKKTSNIKSVFYCLMQRDYCGFYKLFGIFKKFSSQLTFLIKIVVCFELM